MDNVAAGWPGFTYFQFHNFIERYHHLLIAPALKKKRSAWKTDWLALETAIPESITKAVKGV